MVKRKMVEFTVSLPAKWEQFLKHLADDHEVDLNTVISELCEWALSLPESKEQFEAWLEQAYPSKGEAEDKASAAGEEVIENEEEEEEESEEESHEHRD
jgi:hypothetical protein